MRQHPVARWLLGATLATFATAGLAAWPAPYVGAFAFSAGLVLTVAWLAAEYATHGWSRRHPLDDAPELSPTDQGRPPR